MASAKLQHLHLVKAFKFGDGHISSSNSITALIQLVSDNILIMTRTLLLAACLLVVVNAGTYGGQKTSLEDIERDNNSDQKSNYMQPKAISSPTKFGFVPKRTAASYAATKPKPQYLQTTYKVKQSPPQAQLSQYQQPYTTSYTQPQASYQQYSPGSSQQYALQSSSSISDNSHIYSSSGQQYVSPQQAQDYVYVQPEVQQQYAVQYQQPANQYEQYENVQYVTDNSVANSNAQAPQPQYYYVQQYQSPSTAVESIIDPKGLQYVSYFPSYSLNSIPIDSKQTLAYTTSSEPQLPPVTTTIAKYTTHLPNKGSSTKHYVSQKEVQYVAPSANTQFKQEDNLVKREPKSLLDSYVPSIVQLQYLKQQGKGGHEYSKF